MKPKDSGNFKQFALRKEAPSHYGTATRESIDAHVRAFQQGIKKLVGK